MTNKYKLKISGKNIKRYLGYLIDSGISLYSIKINKNELIIIVDEEGYNELLKLKTSYKISLIDEYGSIKIKYNLKKYSILLICIVLGLTLIFILSNIVFDIKIKHSKSEIRELIRNDLEEFGIEKYHFKVSYKKKEEIINKILEKERDRIEWIEIESVGTKYIINVEERIKNKVQKDNKTQHIVAKKNSRILEIKAESGDILVKKNDYVSKGDILISGFITKDEEIKKKVKALGTVYGEVWYQVSINVPKVYKEVKYTNNMKKRIEINFLNKDFLLFDFKPYKSYKTKRKTLYNDKLLPIKISYSTVLETKNIEKRYTTKEAEKEIFELAEKKLKNMIGVNSSIISKKILKKKEKDSKIEIDIFFKVKEDITDTLNIDNIEIGDNDGASN